MKKKILCLCIMMVSLLMLAGCGKKGNTEVLVLDSDTGGSVRVSVTDTKAGCLLKSTKKGFDITGGNETVHGSILSATDAELLNSEQYGQDGYSVISIGDSFGFSCVTDGSYCHVFQPDGMGVYVCLTAKDSDANIYAAEECISFQSVSDKKE